MTLPTGAHDPETRLPDLGALAGYLREAGWTLDDEDGRTTMWRLDRPKWQDFRVVLPVRQEVSDYEDRVSDALRTLAYVERRLPEEVADDVSLGGADTVAVRLTPDAPPGEAPLSLAHSAVSALRSYVIGSAAIVESQVPPAPGRGQAESYTDRVRFSTHPGSFVLTLALPLMGTPVGTETAEKPALAQADVPSQPFGRRVTNRMAAVARRSHFLAEEVGAGHEEIFAFGEVNLEAADATELGALSDLGGDDRTPYWLRFAQSPLAPERQNALTLYITPGQQQILGEAADFLRTRRSRTNVLPKELKPRNDVTVEGLIVRLDRGHSFGPGTIVVQGTANDSSGVRRFRAQLTEQDYNDALRAHQEGLNVIARGDLDIRGRIQWLRPLRSFSVLSRPEDDK